MISRSVMKETILISAAQLGHLSGSTSKTFLSSSAHLRLAPLQAAARRRLTRVRSRRDNPRRGYGPLRTSFPGVCARPTFCNYVMSDG
jgi:hypothetical protein